MNVSSESNRPLDGGCIVGTIILRGHRNMLLAPEGGIKTMLVTSLVVHVAAGEPFLGMPVTQAPVLVIDEETPLATLEDRLNRFSNGLGIKSYRALPIEVLSKTGYKFHSKTCYEQIVIPAINRLMKKVPNNGNLLITTDSVIACLGATSHGSSENQDKAGKDIKNAQDMIVKYCDTKFDLSSTLITTIHTKKAVAQYSLKELQATEMQVLARGHGSMIGLNCDSGLMVMKASARPQLSGILIIKSRRSPIDLDVIYFKLDEETYGKGPPRFTICDPIPIPPTDLEVCLYSLFCNNPADSYKEGTLKRQMALHVPAEIRSAIDKLQDYRAIKSLSKDDPFSYIYNVDFERADVPAIEKEYRRQLREKYEEMFPQDIGQEV